MLTDPTLDPAWPAGYGCLRLDVVDSTMAEAVRQQADIQQPTWIIATRQTAARGRRGKVWQTPAGNLNATLVYHPACTPKAAAQRSFMAAVALFEALALYVDRDALALKWPNDVLLDGGKIAGILLETAGAGAFVDYLSVGIGVNLSSAPSDLAGAAFPPVSLLGCSGSSVTPAAFLTSLAGAFATQEMKLATFGFDRIRKDWLRHAARLGEIITARTGTDDITGVFQTIDGDGNLVLETATGRRAIPAADIYFRE